MSREKILANIKKNKPDSLPIPELPVFNRTGLNCSEKFRQTVIAGAGQVVEITDNQSLTTWIQQQFPSERRIASTWHGIGGNVDLTKITSPAELENVDIAILPARLGVAENGAVWLTESDCRHRILPFITQHLVVVLKKENIVADMHEAYRQIQVNETGFGVFIAGPSKTADIEQALVIGAQGARSFTVWLV